MRHAIFTRALVAGCAIAATFSSLSAQSAGDTLTLAALQASAEQHDARASQAELLAAQSELRRTTLRREGLPALGATLSGQYLSDVTTVPGAPLPGPLQQQYDAHIAVRHTLFDPTRRSRLATEQAQLDEAQAALRGTLWQQRLAVNEVFFTVLLARERQRTITAMLTDLAEREGVARTRVEAGAALPSELLLIEAERTRQAQALADARSEESAARQLLSELAGLPVGPTTVLAVPPLDSTPLPAPGRDRPEFTRFAEGRAAIDASGDALRAQSLPRVALVGRTGYGRPGLNQLGREFDSYYVAGLQVEWSPWDWGASRRAQEVRTLQARIVEGEEAAFADALERSAITEQARIHALEDALAADERVVALRARVLAEARLRHDEGELATADYVSRLTEHVTAQLARDTRRIQLAAARARYLTTIGREVR